MIDPWDWVVPIILVLWAAKELFGNSAEDDEEKLMPYDIDTGNCTEDELLEAKVECLRLALGVAAGASTDSDVVISDAQKFWNFLIANSEDSDED